MSECDLLVCSHSSFSMMAAFLSEASYIMYKKYTAKKDGKYLLWDEDIYNYNNSLENDNARGILIGDNETLNEKLLLYLENKIKERTSINKELIFGGKC
jgi:hypothetical protein